jgi:hypothetical protein
MNAPYMLLNTLSWHHPMIPWTSLLSQWQNKVIQAILATPGNNTVPPVFCLA